MREGNKRVLTTSQAMHRLNISRGTFFSRLKEQNIKPVNFNPNQRKQHAPVWRLEDVDKLGTPVNVDDDEEARVALLAG